MASSLSLLALCDRLGQLKEVLAQHFGWHVCEAPLAHSVLSLRATSRMAALRSVPRSREDWHRSVKHLLKCRLDPSLVGHAARVELLAAAAPTAPHPKRRRLLVLRGRTPRVTTATPKHGAARRPEKSDVSHQLKGACHHESNWCCASKSGTRPVSCHSAFGVGSEFADIRARMRRDAWCSRWWRSARPLWSCTCRHRHDRLF